MEYKFENEQEAKSFIIEHFNKNRVIVNKSRFEVYFDNPELCKYVSNYLLDKAKVKCMIVNDNLVYEHGSIIDLFAYLYGDYNEEYLLDNSIHSLLRQVLPNQDTLYFVKNDKDAVTPFKTRYSDIGYDLTIIKEYKKLNDKTTLYDTGISLVIPVGYYVSIHPRSSLSKSGYMLANSEGIIDPTYTGNILVALTKVVDISPPIQLPFIGVQLVMKKAYYPRLVEINKSIETSRGSGGFGSTT